MYIQPLYYIIFIPRGQLKNEKIFVIFIKSCRVYVDTEWKL